MRNRIVMVDILTRKFKSVYYKQYDENNELNIVVYEGKTLANISNYAATVYFELPSGKVYEVDGVIENNAIKVILSSSILEEYGQVNVECKLSNLDEVVTTFTFYLNVEKSINRVGILNPDVQPPQQTYHTHSNLDVLNQITQEMIDSIDSSEELVDLSIYQTKKDTTLETDEKTVTGAINELNEKIENISVNVDLSDYALKSEIPIVPTNVSELNNDSGYLTEVPSEYITETELANKGFATESFVTNKISESQLSDEQAQQLNVAYTHSQTPHVQQSDIPTKTSQLTNDSDFATNASVDEKIANVSAGGSVDLTSYAKKTDIPTKTSQLTNDSGFITEHQDISNKADRSEIPTKTSQLQNDSNFISSIPNEYITETELESKGYLTEHQSLEDYALKTELPSVPTKTSQLTNDSGYITKVPSEYITETELNEKGYLTEHQDISNKANKSDIPTKTSQLTNDNGFITTIPSEYITESELNTELSTKANITDIPSLDGYATETYVTNKIAEASLSGGEVDLSGYATKDELKTKANVSHTHTMSNITDLVIPDVDKAYVDTQLNTKANKTDIPSLDGYALKTDIPTVPTKVSDLTNDSGYITEVPSEYVTETELNAKGFLTEHQDISNKADKSEIPTKTSQLTNDSNFLTEHQDISNKADKLYVDTELAKKSNTNHTHNQYLTKHQDISGKADKLYVDTELAKKSDKTHTHSYNDLSDKPVIPSIDGLATKKELTDGLATKSNTNHTHDQYLTEHQDLSDYALKSEIPTVPTKTSQLTNDSGFITSIPSEYVTETELNAKGYLTQHQDISGKANTSDLSTVATSGSYNDLTNKPTIPSVTDVNNAIKYQGIVQPSGDVNNCTTTGFYKIQQGARNLPVNEYSFLMVYNEPRQQTLIQVWYSATSDKQRIRRRANLTWGNWYTVYTENEPAAIPSEYITETELESKGYLTEHQDISGKADKSYVDTELAKKSDKTHTHNQYLTEHQDISGKADKSEIPTKTSQLTNNSGFLTSIPSEYITESELNAKGYLTSVPSEYVTETELANKGYLTEHQDVSNKADRSDIPTKTSQLTNDSNFLTSVPSEYVTESELNAKGYLTQHQDLSNYALKTELPSVPTKTSQLTNDSGYVTNASVDEKVASAFNNQIPEANILSIVLGNYQIKYNSTDDTLDFLFNGVIDEPVVPPTSDGYVSEGLSLYIDATHGSINDITGNHTTTNHGTSLTSDNKYLNFVSNEQDYIDTDLVPNLTQWSVECYFCFTTRPTISECIASWGASGNRTRIYYRGADGFLGIQTGTDAIRSIIDGSNLTVYHHLIVTMNNGVLISYLDGVKTQLSSDAKVLTSNTGTLKIGTYYNASEDFANINLRMFRFYDGKVLTDEEALQNYNYEISRV